MPLPFKTGYNFKIYHKRDENAAPMKATDIYRDFYGIGYMYQGDRLILTPGKTLVSSTGCVVFIHKSLYHRTTNASMQPYETCSVKFKEAMTTGLISAIGQETYNSLFDDIVVHISDKGKETVKMILNRIMTEWSIYDANNTKASELLLQGLLNELVITVIRERVYDYDAKWNLSPKHQSLVNALTYIEKNFSQNPSLAETARAVNVSPSHLSKLFTANLTTSYSRFLNEEKINHAQKLLVNTDLPMIDIAHQSGYSNSNYFCDVFKKIIGISPLKFRNSMKELQVYNSVLILNYSMEH